MKIPKMRVVTHTGIFRAGKKLYCGLSTNFIVTREYYDF